MAPPETRSPQRCTTLLSFSISIPNIWYIYSISTGSLRCHTNPQLRDGSCSTAMHTYTRIHINIHTRTHARRHARTHLSSHAPCTKLTYSYLCKMPHISCVFACAKFVRTRAAGQTRPRLAEHTLTHQTHTHTYDGHSLPLPLGCCGCCHPHKRHTNTNLIIPSLSHAITTQTNKRTHAPKTAETLDSTQI